MLAGTSTIPHNKVALANEVAHFLIYLSEGPEAECIVAARQLIGSSNKTLASNCAKYTTTIELLGGRMMDLAGPDNPTFLGTKLIDSMD